MTSRQNARYLEQHLILSNGKNSSVGFSEIACDDSQTLLEQCVGIFKNLCKVYRLDDASVKEDEWEKEIIRKLQCLLSDRASVMKAFGSKMAKYTGVFCFVFVFFLGGILHGSIFSFYNAHF